MCVIDVEATCEENDRRFPHEIIEWPMVLLDRQTGETVRAWSHRRHGQKRAPPMPHETVACPIPPFPHALSIRQQVAERQTFVRPELNPVLSKFCTALTGIQQEQVDAAPTWETALADSMAWLQSCGYAWRTIPQRRPNENKATLTRNAHP